MCAVTHKRPACNIKDKRRQYSPMGVKIEDELKDNMKPRPSITAVQLCAVSTFTLVRACKAETCC